MREIAQVHVERSARKALVQSDRLQSARLVESVQTRESEMVTRREEEIRERNAAHAAMAAHKAQSGFDVTVRTTEGHLNYSDEDTASMSEYTAQDPIEPILIDRSHYSKSELRDMQSMSHMAHMVHNNQRQISKFDVLSDFKHF